MKLLEVTLSAYRFTCVVSSLRTRRASRGWCEDGGALGGARIGRTAGKGAQQMASMLDVKTIKLVVAKEGWGE